ncbi:MAG: glycosyltransferase, partial [Planctomycetota bacterium]|nr:glycosyltransferase [Planctomycetota bacterium]
GFCPPLAEALGDDVLAVSSVAVDGEGRTVDGARLGELKRGTLRWLELDREHLTELHPSAYPVGAHVLLDRARFLELGGFDPLYRPFYWEDADLGYRAWKRGWQVLIEPRSQVEHRREGSDIQRTVGEATVAPIMRRNRVLFMWANLHDRRLLLLQHLVPFCLRVLTGWIVWDTRFYGGLFEALGRLGEARRSRARNRVQATRTDREVLAHLEGALRRHVPR